LDGLNVLIGVATGFVIAAAAVWLLLRNQADGAYRRGRDEVLAQLERAQQQLGEREAELARLRVDLRQQLELRAKAEEKALQAAQLADQLRAAQEDNVRLREKTSTLGTQLAEERKQAEEKLKLLNDAREQLTIQFRNLANEILEDKSKRFTEQNKNNLDGLLSPLKEQLKDFEKKVHEVYDKETRDRVSLFNEITRLKELNQRISEDAVNLTRALKGESKTQGIWGEMILEQLLEKSGLTKGREYEVQASFTSEDGRRQQPDVIVKLPEGKHVIIDSKVSLTAYERFCSANDEAEQLAALKEHCTSLRNHCRGLSAKAYEQLGIRTLDYVLLFVPVEPAYIEAVRHDAELFGDALEKNIIIATPSTLLAMLRTIHNIWRFEYQNRHATEIADKAGRLYDKFVGFVADLEEVGKRLDAAQRAHEDAFKKLKYGRGNLVKTADDIKALGAKAAKSLPAELVEEAVEEQPLLQAVGADDD
jgi:DNA recombination protein RmuC